MSKTEVRTAAMKKVLSPISVTMIISSERKKESTKPSPAAEAPSCSRTSIRGDSF
jgi:hypothetical protein